MSRPKVCLACLVLLGAGCGAATTPVRQAPRENPAEFVFVWPARPGAAGAPQTTGDRIRKVVQAEVRGLRRCYNKALIRDPALRISLQVAFTVETTGEVSRLDVEGRRPLSGALMACFRRKMRQWIFFRLPIPVRYGPFVMSLRPHRSPPATRRPPSRVAVGARPNLQPKPQPRSRSQPRTPPPTRVKEPPSSLGIK